jgi:hypothetical protein
MQLVIQPIDAHYQIKFIEQQPQQQQHCLPLPWSVEQVERCFMIRTHGKLEFPNIIPQKESWELQTREFHQHVKQQILRWDGNKIPERGFGNNIISLLNLEFDSGIIHIIKGIEGKSLFFTVLIQLALNNVYFNFVPDKNPWYDTIRRCFSKMTFPSIDGIFLSMREAKDTKNIHCKCPLIILDPIQEFEIPQLVEFLTHIKRVRHKKCFVFVTANDFIFYPDKKIWRSKLDPSTNQFILESSSVPFSPIVSATSPKLNSLISLTIDSLSLS